MFFALYSSDSLYSFVSPDPSPYILLTLGTASFLLTLASNITQHSMLFVPITLYATLFLGTVPLFSTPLRLMKQLTKCCSTDEYPAAIQRAASVTASGVIVLAAVLASVIVTLLSAAPPPHR